MVEGIKLNREARRKKNSRRHINFFTKKYKSEGALKYAMSILPEKIQMKLIREKMKKRAEKKEKKQNDTSNK